MRHRPPEMTSERSLRRWLEDQKLSPLKLTKLAGDVSIRRYFRVDLASAETAILVLYPRQIRDACDRFRRTTRLLERAGVGVPAIVAADCAAGLMVVEDLGSGTLYDLEPADWGEFGTWLEEGLRLIDRIAAIPVEQVEGLNPPLDRRLLWRELRQTWELYLEPQGLVGKPPFSGALRELLERLCRRLGEEAPVTCHRDFMARNLIPDPARRTLRVLDHQDLRAGPRFYDFASFLNDSLFPPAAVQRSLLASRLANADDRLSYHRAAAQRTLKAVGTFAAFRRRGVDRHDRLIGPTLGRALDHLRDLPEATAIAAEMDALWRPLATPG